MAKDLCTDAHGDVPEIESNVLPFSQAGRNWRHHCPKCAYELGVQHARAAMLKEVEALAAQIESLRRALT
jgi:hypothetical protein